MDIIIGENEIRELAEQVSDRLSYQDYTPEEVAQAVADCLAFKIESAKDELFDPNTYKSVRSFLCR